MISREDLDAYLKLRSHGKPISVRGFQRLMNYSSPGKAQRILNRLERLGFIEKTKSNEYIVKADLPPQLAAYAIVKGYIIPRIAIYTLYTTTTITLYIALAKPPIHIAILLIALAIPYWIETIKLGISLKTLLKQKIY